MTLTRSAAVLLAGLTYAAAPLAAQHFELPPEVTPALRAACEADVRRMCIDDSPTVEKVKACVQRRYSELSARCKIALVAAGLGGGQATPKEPARRAASTAAPGAKDTRPDSVANFFDR